MSTQDLHEVTAAQLPIEMTAAIYEFMFGDANYRRRRYRFDYVLDELRQRLALKLAHESNLLKLNSALTTRMVKGEIASIDYSTYNPSAEWAMHRLHKHIVHAFPTETTCMRFIVDWTIDEGKRLCFILTTMNGRQCVMAPDWNLDEEEYPSVEATIEGL